MFVVFLSEYKSEYWNKKRIAFTDEKITKAINEKF